MQKNKKKQHHTPNNNSPPKDDVTELTEDLKELSLNGPNVPYSIAKSDIYGRYLIAKRDLRPGEILITEKPLAVGPCVSADPVCLGCYMPVTLKETQYR